ncbi:unnamed protein product [Closterium sp. NIES-64]|nr:unnamed protein product [Closterium sp. NIES-64]
MQSTKSFTSDDAATWNGLQGLVDNAMQQPSPLHLSPQLPSTYVRGSFIRSGSARIFHLPASPTKSKILPRARTIPQRTRVRSGAGNGASGDGNGASGAGNGASGAGNGASGAGNGASGAGIGASGAGNGASGYGNGASGDGNGASGDGSGSSGAENGAGCAGNGAGGIGSGACDAGSRNGSGVGGPTNDARSGVSGVGSGASGGGSGASGVGSDARDARSGNRSGAGIGVGSNASGAGIGVWGGASGAEYGAKGNARSGGGDGSLVQCTDPHTNSGTEGSHGPHTLAEERVEEKRRKRQLSNYTRATNGAIVADKNREKIHYMAPNIYCCGAGTAADTAFVTEMVSAQLALYRQAKGRQLRVNLLPLPPIHKNLPPCDPSPSPSPRDGQHGSDGPSAVHHLSFPSSSLCSSLFFYPTYVVVSSFPTSLSPSFYQGHISAALVRYLPT